MPLRIMEIPQDSLARLIQAAREASEMAFLTKPGGTRYGAAALTVSGNMFRAGQYSSFNHITNIHAEMAAIVSATMAGEPHITALALVCTSFPDTPARPCGVCRQFLYEHAVRTGWDILVAMAGFEEDVIDCEHVSALLPKSWVPRSAGEV